MILQDILITRNGKQIAAIKNIEPIRAAEQIPGWLALGLDVQIIHQRLE